MQIKVSNLNSFFAIGLKPEIVTSFLETSIFIESGSCLSGSTLLFLSNVLSLYKSLFIFLTRY